MIRGWLADVAHWLAVRAERRVRADLDRARAAAGRSDFWSDVQQCLDRVAPWHELRAKRARQRKA